MIEPTPVEVRGLTFRYRRRQPPVLTDIHHRFEPATVTAITGPSGGGKSTLLYLIGLLLAPEQGDVVVGGIPAATGSDRDRSQMRSRTMGFVFQDAMLDPSRTVLANVMEGAVYTGMPADRRQSRARELLQELGIDHRAEHRPGEISGGQAQRVALCRALVKSPPVILADEPTGNLDTDAADLVWNILDQQARAGCTVIVATHDRARAIACTAHLDLADTA
ncbi:ABC transporter ATP-binding protein [Nakamurella lactea]|uniref:ABC transporter ATP-binding protein n=1 Tax=Nakamurella lactea TaxID=459515 RepID=UPI0003F9A418|nr:ATP-binding cassette domain-containing protein [Nakamurella lactea]